MCPSNRFGRDGSERVVYEIKGGNMTIVIDTVIGHARNAPREPERRLPRDNLIQAIEKSLAKSDVVFVEGEAISGKTECVAEFMRRHEGQAIAAFLTPNTPVFYSPVFARQTLGEQAYMLVNNMMPCPDDYVIDDREFAALLLRLQRVAKKKVITFIVDGLSDAEGTDRQIALDIMRMLPLGQSEFRFLFTGSERLYASPIFSNKGGVKKINLVDLSREEANSYLGDLALNANDIDALYKMCGGNIGFLEKIRALLVDGASVSDLLGERNPSLANILEIEWDRLPQSEVLNGILGLLAWSQARLTENALAELTGLSIEVVREVLSTCRLVSFDESSSSWLIRSDLQRNFVKKKLVSRKDEIEAKLIERLMASGENPESTLNLPSQLINAGRHSEALGQLTPNHFARLLSLENSLKPLRLHAEFGLESAREEDDINAQLRFALTTASVTSASIGGGSSLEIEALLALDYDEEACALALSSPVLEERVQCLSTVAACCGRRGKPIPGQVNQSLRELISSVADDLPDAVLASISSDLLSVDIDLALSVAAKLHSREFTDRIESWRRGTKPPRVEDEPGRRANGDAVAHQEAALELKPLFEAASTLVNKLTVDEVLAKVEPLEQRHKSFLLLRWLERHRRHPEAARVALVAISVALAETTRAPRLKELREIAIVVPHIALKSEATEVIERLDAQRRSLTSNGTTEDAVRLEMLILRAKRKHLDSTVEEDLVNLHYSIASVTDVGNKTACYAWMLYHLNLMEGKDEIEEKTSVISETTRCLMDSIETLLGQTAEHFRCAKDTIRAICMSKPELAMALAKKLNTQFRREEAYRAVAVNLAKGRMHNVSANVICECVQEVQNESQREELIVGILSHICRNLKENGPEPVDPRLLVMWKQSRFSYKRLEAIVLTYKIHLLSHSVAPTMELLTEAESVWGDIPVGGFKWRNGFWVVKELAQVNKTLAKEWLMKVRGDLKSERTTSIAGDGHIYFMAQLVARAAVSLIGAIPGEYEKAIGKLDSYVSVISLQEDRAAIWNMVSVALHFQKQRDLSSRVVKEKIEPLLAQSFENNGLIKNAIIYNASPALYLNHPVGADAMINQIPYQAGRDSARAMICNVIFRKQCASLPFQDRFNSEFSLDYAETSDIIHLLKQIRKDSHIHAVVSDLCASLAAKKNRVSLRRSQIMDILTEISVVVSSQLPDRNNIQHDGFLIASQAHLLRCKLSLGMGGEKSEWKNLLSAAEKITNAADRVIVVSMVASCAGRVDPFVDAGWFARLRADMTLIPSDVDRLDRLRWAAEILEPVDKNVARILLRDAMSFANQVDESDKIDSVRQKVLDLAHNIDPAFCDELIDFLDDDEAKIAKNELRHYSKILNCRKEAASGIDRFQTDGLNMDDIIEISLRNHAALNAGRQLAQPTKDFVGLVRKIRHNPIDQVYPVWQWVLENGLKKATQQAGPKILPAVFDSLSAAADVALVLVRRGGMPESSGHIDAGDSIGPGDREIVYSRIRSWVSSENIKKIQISDPFFGPDDLDIVKVIAEVRPDLEIEILTSRKQMNQRLRDNDIEEAFRDAWDELCEQAPPATEIFVVGFGAAGEHPIHDRWIVAETTGLRLGTSANSLGYLRVSEISELSAEQTLDRAKQIRDVLHRSTRDWQGHRLTKTRFSL